MSIVTVVTPTTGRATLAQCEASVAAQTVPCIHSVVFNHDGDYGNRARNRAVHESNTPYIAMLDDDDWYEPDFISVMLDVLQKTGADIAYCRSRMIDRDSGQHLGSWFHPFDAALLARVPYIATNTILGKREVFEQCPYDAAGTAYNADWRMYLNAIGKGFKFVSVDVELSNYRTHAGAWAQWAEGGYLPAGEDVPQHEYAPNAEIALILHRTFPMLYAGASVLYVGAHPQSRAFADEIAASGSQVDLLEAWYPNALHYQRRGKPFDWVTHGTLQGSSLKGYNFAMWIQGPEHVKRDEVDDNLRRLASLATHAIVTCPFGEYPQGDEYGNPYERHLSTLYPQDFQRPGWHTRTIGQRDTPNGCILAYT